MRQSVRPYMFMALFFSVAWSVAAAHADIDMTGEWLVDLTDAGGMSWGTDELWEFEQTGTSLTVMATVGPGYYTGTIDPGTGYFSVATSPSNCSHMFDPEYCEIEGLANAAASSFWAGILCRAFFPTSGCVESEVGAQGSRGCGDGLLWSGAGEQCDDGNTEDGDCCTATCQAEPDGLYCDDGDPGTGPGACVAGSCEAPLTAIEFRVNLVTEGKQNQPAVADDEDGNFVVVWTSDNLDLGVDDIFARRYDSRGAPLGPEFRVNTQTLGAGWPAVASDAKGRFIVAWEDTGDVLAQRFDSNGAFAGTEFRVNTYSTLWQRSASVAAHAVGNFVIAWNSELQDGDGLGVFGQRYDSAGTSLGSEFQINTYTPGHQGAPKVAMGASGNFVVVWGGEDGDSFGTYAQRFDSNGSATGTEFRVNTNTIGHQGPSAIAADAQGNFVVTWGNDDVFGQRFDRNGIPHGSNFLVSEYMTGRQNRSSVSVDGAGNFIVAWARHSGNRIFAQRFDGTGTRLGGEFEISTYTAGTQTDPFVSANANGSFVIAWSGSGEGDSSGVFARLYASPRPRPDQFKCYKARDLKKPKFLATTVGLADQFGVNDGPFEVRRPFFVCNPTDKNGTGINIAESHLACYRIKGPRLDAADRPKVEVVDQFGLLQLEAKRPFLFCVPSAKTVLP